MKVPTALGPGCVLYEVLLSLPATIIYPYLRRTGVCTVLQGKTHFYLTALD